MAQVFISYDNEDRERIRPLADALEASGVAVFRDRNIPPGSTWRQVLDRELARAHCVVVVWSRASIASPWVIEEADFGKGRENLIPVRIDRVDPPLGFRTLQAADLAGWNEQASDPAFVQLLSTVRGQTGDDAVHLTVMNDERDYQKYRVSVLGRDLKSGELSVTRNVDPEKSRALLARFAEAVTGGEKNLQQFGKQLATSFLPADARTALAKMKRRHIVIVNDQAWGRIPWETLTIGRWTPALASGLSRRHALTACLRRPR